MPSPAAKDYAYFKASVMPSIKAQEHNLPLRHQACCSQFLLHPAATSKVCLFFHGFTAAPYQFLPMGRAFHQAGYNVVIPLMPGHGRAGKWNQNTPPPLPQDDKSYKEFASYWLEQVQALGDQVIVAGLSGGGTLAAWLAQTYPKTVDCALLFAPYLSSSNKVIDLFVKSFNSYFEWQTDAPPEQVIGYSGFQLPALRVFLKMGREILQASGDRSSAPLFIVSTESDQGVSNTDHRVLFENVLKRQPKTWYHCFDRYLNIPHTMMTVAEGNRWENLLNVMAKAYVQSKLTWAEVKEIGYRMSQGKTFNQVVAELGLTNKVSPDMPAMMTMIDKRAIALERNSKQGQSNQEQF